MSLNWESLPFYLMGIGALGFLIVVHEAGHYIVARWCGMRVERFSVGFGWAIFKYKSKTSGTTFQLAPIPFGGFVEIRGMNIAEEVEPDDAHAYPNRPAWQRFVTIFAGPATNYLSAIAIMFLMFTCRGVDSNVAYIGVDTVLAGYDSAGKLVEGDRILKVDGKDLFAGVKDDSLTGRVSKKAGAPVTLTVLRDEREHDVTITPKAVLDVTYGEMLDALALWSESNADGALIDKLKTKKYVYYLGIRPAVQIDPVQVGIIEAAGRALRYPIEKTKVIVGGLHDIVTGKEKADPGGPVRIVDEFGKAFKYGLSKGIELLALLSVYLGLFNLFPLPALDGGRLVFLGYELVTRRRANPKIESMVHMGGIMVLFVVMILVTLNDCSLIG